MGRGVPQKRERETAQSRADSSQLWKLFFLYFFFRKKVSARKKKKWHRRKKKV